METEFFKKVTPFAVVAMAIFGAFATTSMQSVAKSKVLVPAFTLNSAGRCDIPVECSQNPNPVCQLNETGPQAFGMDEDGDCTEILNKP